MPPAFFMSGTFTSRALLAGWRFKSKEYDRLGRRKSGHPSPERRSIHD
jgi:hypothetical protein